MAEARTRRTVPLVLRSMPRKLLTASPGYVAGPTWWLAYAIRALCPLPAFRTYACDELVAGANPLLNALALLAAVRAGRSVVLAPTVAADAWHHDVLTAPDFRRFVTSAAGLPGGPEGAALAEWAAWFFARVREEIAAAPRGDVALLPRPCELVASPRWTAAEAMVLVRRGEARGGPAGFGGPGAALAAAWRVALERALPVIEHRWDAGSGAALYLFAPRIVLSSLCVLDAVEVDAAASVPGADVRFRAANPHIVPLGSARRQTQNTRIALEGAIEDVLAALGRPAGADAPAAPAGTEEAP